MLFADRCRLLAGAYSARDIARGAAPWLTDALIATPVAERRLRRWIDMGRPSPHDVGPLELAGCKAVLDVVERALERIPEPVVVHVVQNCVIAGISTKVLGWFAPRLPQPKHAVEPGQLIVISGHSPDVEATTAHEVAHAWLLERETNISPQVAAPAEKAFFNARNEWQAESLMASWGFRNGVWLYARHLRDARRSLEHIENEIEIQHPSRSSVAAIDRGKPQLAR